jgi:lysozyme
LFGHSLWIAEYGVQTPKIPPDWQTWTFWQFTQTQKLPSSEKPVDASYFNGSVDDLKKLLMAGDGS